MVRGYCIYGGWMIATAMDLIFASQEARFLAGQFEYFSVPWDIHPRKAKELIFESRFLNADEAREQGLVTRVYAPERLEDDDSVVCGAISSEVSNPAEISRLISSA